MVIWPCQKRQVNDCGVGELMVVVHVMLGLSIIPGLTFLTLLIVRQRCK